MCGITAVIGSDIGVEAAKLHEGVLHRGKDGVGAAGFQDVQSRAFHYIGDARKNLNWQMEIPVIAKGMTAILTQGRYPTTEDQTPKLENTPPLSLNTKYGQVLLAHNGNLVDANKLRRELISRGAVFQGTSDSEIILHLINEAPISGSDNPIKDAVIYALKVARGSYSCLIMFPDRLYAACDPRAVQPLVMYQGEKNIYFASEDSAFLSISETLKGIVHLDQADLVEVLFTKNGAVVNGPEKFITSAELPAKAHCAFNFVYLAKHLSSLWGRSVLEMREKFGMALYAKVAPVLEQFDLMAEVPNTALPMLAGLARFATLPQLEILAKATQDERTFMNLGASKLTADDPRVISDNLAQSLSASGKYRVITSQDDLSGKSIIVLDDSFVRGRTAIDLLRTFEHYGVKRVLFLSASPVISEICNKGVYISSYAELLARGANDELLNEAEMAKILKEKAGVKLDVEICFLGLLEFANCFGSMSHEMCYACMGGADPLPIKS